MQPALKVFSPSLVVCRLRLYLSVYTERDVKRKKFKFFHRISSTKKINTKKVLLRIFLCVSRLDLVEISIVKFWVKFWNLVMTKLRKYSTNAEYTLTTSNHSSHLYVVYSTASDSEQYLMAFYTVFHLFTHHSSSFISSSGFFFSSDFILSTCGYSFST